MRTGSLISWTRSGMIEVRSRERMGRDGRETVSLCCWVESIGVGRGAGRVEIGNGSVLDYKLHSDQETTMMDSSKLTNQSRSNAARTPGLDIVLGKSEVAGTSTFPPRWPHFPIPKKHNPNSCPENGKTPKSSPTIPAPRSRKRRNLASKGTKRSVQPFAEDKFMALNNTASSNRKREAVLPNPQVPA